VGDWNTQGLKNEKERGGVKKLKKNKIEKKQKKNSIFLLLVEFFFNFGT
jgi:hypothetical protein